MISLEKNPTTGLVLDQLGPVVEFLNAPEDARDDFCVLKGTLAPGTFVPLHSHADTEGFFVMSGEIEGLRQDEDGYTWVRARAGDYIHVPGDARHAWRNFGSIPVVCLIITTRKMGKFFQETGRPLADATKPLTPEILAHFAAVSARYGYWNGTPEENAAVGINMSF